MIKIYSTPTCPYCLQALAYFKNKNLEYEKIDVSKDQKAAEEMVKISGQMGVPVIQIDDKVLIGFEEDEVEKLLKN